MASDKLTNWIQRKYSSFEGPKFYFFKWLKKEIISLFPVFVSFQLVLSGNKNDFTNLIFPLSFVFDHLDHGYHHCGSFVKRNGRVWPQSQVSPISSINTSRITNRSHRHHHSLPIYICQQHRIPIAMINIIISIKT